MNTIMSSRVFTVFVVVLLLAAAGVCVLAMGNAAVDHRLADAIGGFVGWNLSIIGIAVILGFDVDSIPFDNVAQITFLPYDRVEQSTSPPSRERLIAKPMPLYDAIRVCFALSSGLVDHRVRHGYFSSTFLCPGGILLLRDLCGREYDRE